jgi:hypothetical protein
MIHLRTFTVSLWFGLSLSLIALSALSLPAQAVAPAQAAPPAENSGATQPIDVVVVLDDSGSMATCWPWPRESPPFEPPCRAPSVNPPSDPEELRYSAARLLVQLADDEDRIAVVRFDSAAEGVGAVGTLQRAGDEANRLLLANSLVPPTDYYPRGYTRIDLGVEAAVNLLQTVREPGRNQYILLLTDGEPTQPTGTGRQSERIAGYIQAIRDAGIFVFPVVLCNPSAGCSGEFLREQFANFGVNEAKTAADLLRIFSEIFSQMKPDRSVITFRNREGALQVTTRAPHGVRKIAFITPRGALAAVRRNEEPMLTRNALNDPNIDVNVIDSGLLAEGKWTAETADTDSFAVIQADSYPQLINPPPSIANSPASIRYYPAGKSPLLIARSVGPGAGEPLLYGDEGALAPFGEDNTYAVMPDDEPTIVRLQLGEDAEPLQLARTFRLEPRAGLPTAEVFSPQADAPGLLEDGRARLQVGFGSANVEGLAATAYVFELGTGNARTLVYQVNMNCGEPRLCSDETFRPGDGRTYNIMYVVHGQVDGLRFSDWAEANLELEPAIYLRGLPPELDLAQMPADGWPVELASGTQQEIGQLSAVLTLKRVESGEEMSGVALDFVADVPESGSLPSKFFVQGLDKLRPGQYTGEIKLEAKGPSGLPMDVSIRPGPTLPVIFAVARPVAHIETQALDFGEVMFDTSPNFRLDQKNVLPVRFTGKPFKVNAVIQESSCTGLSVANGDPEARGEQTVVPIQLTSRGPIKPGSCSGSLLLSGPNDDHDVIPQRIDWQVRVASVEWSVVSGDLHLRDLQDAGARIQETVLVRFNGKTPFVVQMEELSAAGSNGAGADGVALLTSEYVDMPPVEITGSPNESGLYEVPITLIARQPIPKDMINGTFYSGQLHLSLAGLDEEAKTVNFNFRSPSLYQRYIAPIVVPVYSLPWLLCTGPLTALVLLVLIARFRGRNFDEQEIEQSAMAAVAKTVTPVAPVASDALFAEAVAPARVQNEALWGNSEWGSVWAGSPGNEGGDPVASGHAASSSNSSHGSNAAASADAWSTSW